MRERERELMEFGSIGGGRGGEEMCSEWKNWIEQIEKKKTGLLLKVGSMV
jgi:hypothetical protein